MKAQGKKVEREKKTRKNHPLALEKPLLILWYKSLQPHVCGSVTGIGQSQSYASCPPKKNLFMVVPVPGDLFLLHDAQKLYLCIPEVTSPCEAV